ncbi:MAG: c-type cytochrome [Burkholderiales bacterium]
MKSAILTAAAVVLMGMVATAQAADAAAGKAKAAACAGCHGANGEGSGPNPALAGMPAAKFVQAMKDYKSGKRANPVMKNFATPLNDADMANLAAHYASLKKK